MIKTIKAAEIPSVKELIDASPDTPISDSIDDIVKLIYTWATENGNDIVNMFFYPTGWGSHDFIIIYDSNNPCLK